MLAVIKTGGKQYKVQAKDKIRVEKLNAEKGQTVEFDQVLLVGDDNKIKVGTPVVEGAKVTATVIRQGRTKKVAVVKYKNKTRYSRNVGHRQCFTELEIQSIA
ncbi:MAG: 50S ribosomal protein L21 [Patescibacteria group bacterium]